MADRAPEADRHTTVRGQMGDALVRHCIRLVEQTFSGCFVRKIDRAGQRRQRPLEPARRDRVTGAADLQGQRPALFVKPGLHESSGRRAVEIVAHVVFARPEYLHRRAAHGHRHRDRLADEINLQPPAETAAQISDMHGHCFRRHAGNACRQFTRQTRHLGWRPDLDLAALDLGGAIHRLERGMGQIGRAVEGIDFLRRLGQGLDHIALAMEAVALLGGQACRGGQRGRDFGGVERCARVPVNVDFAGCAQSLPAVVGDDGQGWLTAREGGQLDDLQNPGLLQRIRRNIGRPAAMAGGMPDRSKQQARQADVDAEAGPAVDLVSQVDARGRAADLLPIGRRFQPQFTCRCGRRLLGQLAEMGAGPRGVADAAIPHLQFSQR